MATLISQDHALRDVTTRPILRYRLDDHHRILTISGPWDEFAGANGAAALTAEQVKGDSLWDHITGPSVRAVYRSIFEKARVAQTPVNVPFRCDAPSLRREMLLTITPTPSGGFLVESATLQTEALLRSSAPPPPPSKLPVISCSWCNRIHLDDHWVEPAQAAHQVDLWSMDVRMSISHGICADCEADLLAAA